MSLLPSTINCGEVLKMSFIYSIEIDFPQFYLYLHHYFLCGDMSYAIFNLCSF